MIELTFEQAAPRVLNLLKASESKTLEFKRVSGQMVSKALIAISAFANSDGGILVLGLADVSQGTGKARLFGIEENSESVDDLRRKLGSQITPAITDLKFFKWSCMLRNGQLGHLMLIQVAKSDRVHSVVDNGTYIRMDASSRQMTAAEITELSYKRGVRSAEGDALPIRFDLLETATWQTFLAARGLKSGTFPEQLYRIGLAVHSAENQLAPTRAAVLLFAEEPGSLLATHGSRADIRIMVYDGKQIIASSTPNLRKAPKTIRGPLIEQIDATVKVVLDELAQGLTLNGSGFKTKHLYPERVIKEAIVNAVIHRDYRLNRDIFIRIFDDRIEVESPGVFPGNITSANIDKVGSKARNPLLAQNLREFPIPPNIDAGEGVKMMFSEMANAKLYPPQYKQNTDTAVESVTITLLNLERPSIWDEVSHWLDMHSEITNSDLCKIAKVDTLKASKMLKTWVDQGVLATFPNRGKRNMAYTKPSQPDEKETLLSDEEDNK